MGGSGSRSGEPRDAVVTLQKKIPMQAGLGGGSSDAAAALLGLRRLWKLRVPDEQMHALAARLGSDVPFFLVGGTALGLGRGDEVYPLENLPRLLGRAGDSAVRRRHEGRVCVVGRGAKKGSGGVFACVPEKRPAAFWPHVPLVNDLEAPVIGAAPGDRPIEAAADRPRRAHGGDVGQRFDGVRRVQVGARPRSARRGR